MALRVWIISFLVYVINNNDRNTSSTTEENDLVIDWSRIERESNSFTVRRQSLEHSEFIFVFFLCVKFAIVTQIMWCEYVAIREQLSLNFCVNVIHSNRAFVRVYCVVVEVFNQHKTPYYTHTADKK